MKALILNSGMGTRMGTLTDRAPKCMTEIGGGETILSRQLRLLKSNGITQVVMTTGYMAPLLEQHCKSVAPDMQISFVYNPLFKTTNYIYSLYLARELLGGSDLIFMHGDLVFDEKALQMSMACERSTMVVSSTAQIPKGDFKAVIADGRIKAVGVNFFDDCLAAQPLYHLRAADFAVWLGELSRFCEAGTTGCYAENAFNEVSDKCFIFPLDVKDIVCGEIDNPEDLIKMTERLGGIK